MRRCRPCFADASLSGGDGSGVRRTRLRARAARRHQDVGRGLPACQGKVSTKASQAPPAAFNSWFGSATIMATNSSLLSVKDVGVHQDLRALLSTYRPEWRSRWTLRIEVGVEHKAATGTLVRISLHTFLGTIGALSAAPARQRRGVRTSSHDCLVRVWLPDAPESGRGA